MGMQYSLNFVNAVIPPEQYEALAFELGVDAFTPQSLADALGETLGVGGEWDDPRVTDEGIDLSGCGYSDSATYGFGNTWKGILAFCRPGSELHDQDVEDGEAGTTIYRAGTEDVVEEHEEVGIHPGLDSGQSMFRDLGTEATVKIIAAWGGVGGTPAREDRLVVAAGLRSWAKGMLNTMAAVEFLIASGDFVRSWVKRSDSASGYLHWIDWDDFDENGGYLSGGEYATWGLARSIHMGEVGELWRLDGDRKRAFVAALAVNL